MSKMTITDSILTDIADSIRGKLGVGTTYRPGDMSDAIDSIPSEMGTKNIVSNGTYAASDDSLDGYSSVSVNVPNTYVSSDEGKVVSSGALVAQTSTTVTQNGTVDTTLNNEVVVNVSGGGGGGFVDVDAFASPVVFSHSLGVTIEDQSRNGYAVTLDNKEVSSGYEGFNIPITGLTVGDLYKLQFTFQLTSGGYFSGNQYQLGFLVSGIQNTDYQAPLWGNNVTPRDMDPHTFSTYFGATATTMYFSMALSGLSDNSTNYFTLSDLSVKHFADTGGGAKNILHGTTMPTASDGEDGDIYLMIDAGDTISADYLKVSGAWVNLIGSSIDDVNTGDA